MIPERIIFVSRGITVYSCTDESTNSQSFLLGCAVCSRYAFLRLERSLLRWRRTAVRRLHADMLQTVWNELDFRVDVCRISGVPRGVWGVQSPPPRNSDDIGGVLHRMSKKNRRLDFLL